MKHDIFPSIEELIRTATQSHELFRVSSELKNLAQLATNKGIAVAWETVPVEDRPALKHKQATAARALPVDPEPSPDWNEAVAAELQDDLTHEVEDYWNVPVDGVYA